MLCSDRRQDSYRLVRVVGTCKADKQYKLGSKMTDINLEVLNLDLKEVIPIISVSNQGVTEDECSCLRNYIRRRLLGGLKVEEVLQKAKTLRDRSIIDSLEKAKIRVSHRRDRASEAGCRKELRLCVKELELLSSPEEVRRRLNELLEVHTDRFMNPNYYSTDEEETVGTKKDVVRPGQEAVIDQGRGWARWTTPDQNRRWATPEDQDRRRLPGKCDGSKKLSWSQINSRKYDGWQHADSQTNTLRGREMMPSASRIPDNITWEVENKNTVAEQSCGSKVNKTSASERPTNLIKDKGFGERCNNEWEKLTERDQLRSSDSQKWESWGRKPRNQTNSSGWSSWEHADSRKNAQQEERIERDRTVHTGWEAAHSENNVHSCSWEMSDRSVVAEQSWNSKVNASEVSATERPSSVCKDDNWGVHIGKDKNALKKLAQRERSSGDKWECWDKPSESEISKNGQYSWEHADARANEPKKLMEKDHAYTGWETMPSNNSSLRGSNCVIADKKRAEQQSWNTRANSNEISPKERPTNMRKDDSWGAHVGKEKRETSAADKWECWDKPSQSQINSNGWDSWQHSNNVPEILMEKDHNTFTGWETTPSNNTFHHGSDWKIADKKGAAQQSWNGGVNIDEISAKERPINVFKDDRWGVHVGKEKNVSEILTQRERSSPDKWECSDKLSQVQINSNGGDRWRHADTRANAPNILVEKDHNSYTGLETTPSKNSFHRSRGGEIADKKGVAEQNWNNRVNTNEMSTKERPTNVSNDGSWGVNFGKEEDMSKIFSERVADKWECWDKPSQSQMNSNGWDSWQQADRKAKQPEKLVEKDHNLYSGWETTSSNNRFSCSSDWEIADKKGAPEQSWISRGKFVEVSATEKPKDVSQDDCWVARTEKDTCSGWNKASQEKSSKNSVWNELGDHDVGGSSSWDPTVKSILSKETDSQEATGWATWRSKNVNRNYKGPRAQSKEKGRWSPYRKTDHDREDKGRGGHRSSRDKMQPKRSGRRQFSRW